MLFFIIIKTDLLARNITDKLYQKTHQLSPLYFLKFIQELSKKFPSLFNFFLSIFIKYRISFHKALINNNDKIA